MATCAHGIEMTRDGSLDCPTCGAGSLMTTSIDQRQGTDAHGDQRSHEPARGARAEVAGAGGSGGGVKESSRQLATSC